MTVTYLHTVLCSLAGVSRSSTIVVAYMMSVTDLDHLAALDAVRGARRCASPNFGFQRQLMNFQYDGVVKVCSTVELVTLNDILVGIDLFANDVITRSNSDKV